MKTLRHFLCVFLALASFAHADLLDDAAALQRTWQAAILDVYSGLWTPEKASSLQETTTAFGQHLRSETAQKLWLNDPATAITAPVEAARWLGRRQSLLQHVCALEMLERQQHGKLAETRTWRALIQLPKFADAVPGALALQHSSRAQEAQVRQLLAREYLVWQGSLVREKAEALQRLAQQNRATPELLAARTEELEALASFPASLVQVVQPGLEIAAAPQPWRDRPVAEAGAVPAALKAWAGEWQKRLPNLLTEDDVTRRERLLIKLLKLIPKEYAAGVRDGQIIVPLEYREAETFTTQARQILDELQLPWERSRAEAIAQHGAALSQALEGMQQQIAARSRLSEVEHHSEEAIGLLQDKFGISLRRQGKAQDVIAETLLDLRSLLTESLAAAREGDWSKAESLRLEAYTTFDLEIESRTMPRDPALALRVEKLFLDGEHAQPGIKAALDARMNHDALTAAYEAALRGMDECAALLQVGLSPVTAIYTTISVVAREGLEAVVILAALLAGLRGGENRKTRRNIGLGAACALIASVFTFIVSRWFISSLSRHGEALEAVVSVLAVCVLLVVTNWVFHKMYWTEWNSRLRSLTKSVNSTGHTWAMIGVGFLTIYREGFETVLFLQSLLLEAGLRPVLLGLLFGGSGVLAVGIGVFFVGAKLPYRKLLIVTGLLVVTVLVTFLGSTVRLFQTVGWMPIHPIPSLEIPSWVGVWFGFYPSWEGMLIPPLGLVYVGSAWLYVKWRSHRQQAAMEAQMRDEEPQLPAPVSTIAESPQTVRSAIQSSSSPSRTGVGV